MGLVRDLRTALDREVDVIRMGSVENRYLREAIDRSREWCMTAQRDPRVLLLDIDRARCEDRRLHRWHRPRTYAASAGIQDQVERNFITVGEALNRLRQASPELAGRVPEVDDIIGFRHRLVHGYDHVDAETVWAAAQDELPGLRQVVRSLLAELDRTATGPQGRA